MLADCLTKATAKPDNLMTAVKTGILPEVDASPEFRKMLKHKAYLTFWICNNLQHAKTIVEFMNEPISHYVESYFTSPNMFHQALVADRTDMKKEYNKQKLIATIEPYVHHSAGPTLSAEQQAQNQHLRARLDPVG